LYLACFETEILSDLDRFGRDAATRVTAAFPLDIGCFDDSLDVVSSCLIGRVGRPYGAAKLANMRKLHAVYDTFACTHGVLPTVKPKGTNLSYCLVYEGIAMHTAYHNNVFLHFDKYVKRYVNTVLSAVVIARHQVFAARQLPKPVRDELKRVVHVAWTDVLDQRSAPLSPPELHAWLARVLPQLMPLVPPRRREADATTDEIMWASAQTRLYDQKKHPERWLPHMVYIVARLQRLGAKLYEPLPQRSSLVPCHIKLDTQALFDLLVHDESSSGGVNGVQQLHEALEDTQMNSADVYSPKYLLPGVVHTNQKTGHRSFDKNALMGKGLANIIAPHLLGYLDDNAFTIPRFKTAVWRGLTKLGTHRKAQLLADDKVFNNMIDTDGYAVSLHYVKPAFYGQTMFNGGAMTLLQSKHERVATKSRPEFEYVSHMDQAQRQALVHMYPLPTWLSADPGKDVVLHLEDGNGRSVHYTNCQRQIETSQKRNQQEHVSIMRSLIRRVSAPHLAQVGLLFHRPHPIATHRTMFSRRLPRAPGRRDWRRRPLGTTYAGLQSSISCGALMLKSKSCNLAAYCAYLRARVAVLPPLAALYARTGFRRRRYRAFLGRKSSEDKLCHRIRQRFGSHSPIMYGNWGRNPNLRHQAPTPGIGLRRRLHKHFYTVTVNEQMTSSVCNHCEGRGLTKPRTRLLRGEEVETHHLLRCPNVLCARRWWNRDVLGALNILKTGLHCLVHGQWHPCFNR